MRSSKRMIDVVCAIFERDGKVLICRRREGLKNFGKWEFPGGKVNAGEGLKSALKREIKEELGIQIKIISQLSTVKSKDKKYRLNAFLASTDNFINSSIDHDKFMWGSIIEVYEEDLLESDFLILDEITNKYIFTDIEELNTALKHWNKDSRSAEEVYGPIFLWNIGRMINRTIKNPNPSYLRGVYANRELMKYISNWDFLGYVPDSNEELVDSIDNFNKSIESELGAFHEVELENDSLEYIHNTKTTHVLISITYPRSGYFQIENDDYTEVNLEHFRMYKIGEIESVLGVFDNSKNIYCEDYMHTKSFLLKLNVYRKLSEENSSLNFEASFDELMDELDGDDLEFGYLENVSTVMSDTLNARVNSGVYNCSWIGEDENPRSVGFVKYEIKALNQLSDKDKT
jgi:mutator protein MutT